MPLCYGNLGKGIQIGTALKNYTLGSEGSRTQQWEMLNCDVVAKESSALELRAEELWSWEDTIDMSQVEAKGLRISSIDVSLGWSCPGEQHRCVIGLKPWVRQLPSTEGKFQRGTQLWAISFQHYRQLGTWSGKTSGQKRELGRSPQCPLLMAILSELGKGSGAKRQGICFFRDRLTEERTRGRGETEWTEKTDGALTAWRDLETFGPTPPPNTRLYPKEKDQPDSVGWPFFEAEEVLYC